MSRQGEYEKPTYTNIKAFWEKEAKEIGGTPQVTIRDHYFRIHEMHTLLPLIPRCTRLMDIGCGTGFGTWIFSKRASFTLGIDYSEKMIQWAEKLKEDPDYRSQLFREFSPLWSHTPLSRESIKFLQCDITNMNLKTEPFDVMIGQRILINLPTHEDQIKALAQLRQYSSSEGWLFLTEATIQGHNRTDEFRKRFGLPILEKYWHNKYVDENKFVDWQKAGWIVEYDLGFETYMLLSKVIYPAACGPENCEFLSGANAAAMEMASSFRSRCAVDEIGIESFLKMYIKRVGQYNISEAEKIESWVDGNYDKLLDWSHLGHQRLIIAKAC